MQTTDRHNLKSLIQRAADIPQRYLGDVTSDLAAARAALDQIRDLRANVRQSLAEAAEQLDRAEAQARADGW